MNLAARILPALMLTSAIVTGVPGAHAHSKPAISMKPIEALLFDVGTKHGVSYFYPEANHCKLVVTITDDVADDQTFTAERHEADVNAGSYMRYNLSEGKFVEFNCAANAQTMTMKQLERFADKAAK